MKRFVFSTLCFTMALLLAGSAFGDMDAIIEQLCGRADGPARSADELAKTYGQAIDYLIPKMAQDDVEARYAPQILLQDIGSHASRPDAEMERETLCKELVVRLGEDIPQVARVWIVRQLERIGDAESVPALAKLLGSKDEELRDAARRALEKNPSETASKPLRKALKKAKGSTWRIGLINSLGERKDEAAARMLTKILKKDADAAVASAAASSLGHIGGNCSYKACAEPLMVEDRILRISINDPLLADADNYWNGGADLLRCAAMYGIRLVPLATEAITSDDPELRMAAVQAARALEDKKLNTTLAAMSPQLPTETQVQLLQLLTEQPDLANLNHVLPMVASEDETVKEYALRALSTMGSPVSVDALIAAAAQGTGALREAAVKGLARITGEGVNERLTERAESGDEKMRVAAIESFASRQAVEALPALLRYAKEDSKSIRRAAYKAIAEVGADDQVAPLVALALSGPAESRKDAAKALRAVCARVKDPDALSAHFQAAISSASAKDKAMLLDASSVLASDALLQTVLGVCKSKDTELRDAATRALCNWRAHAAAEPLLKLAANPDTDLTYHVLALRGWARLERGASPLPVEERLANCERALKGARRDEEKKTILAVLGTIGDTRSGDILVAYLDDPQLKLEAAMALVDMVEVYLLWTDPDSSLAFAKQVEDRKIARTPTAYAAWIRRHCMKRLGVTAPGLHISSVKSEEGRLPVMLLTGQMNRAHDWKATTKFMKASLEDCGRFAVDVCTSLPKGDGLADWQIDFTKYPVVLLNYDGEMWSEALRAKFEKYVADGGGLVSVHSTDNAFTKWIAYNEMIGVAGWGGRKESAGPYVRWRDGKMVIEDLPGRCGSHGPRHEFLITFREVDPAISKGLPKEWLHGKDELYDRLRGPAKNLTIVATAFSDKEKKGTGEHEPMLMTIRYGKGRIFHTTLGHDVAAMSCAGFQATLQRGTEWAGTGAVTLPAPDDFPTAEKVSLRK